MKEKNEFPALLALLFWLFIGVGSIFVAWQALFIWFIVTAVLSIVIKHGKE